MQMFLLTQRYRAQRYAQSKVRHCGNGFVVMDRSYYGDVCFANVQLQMGYFTQRDYETYLSHHTDMKVHLEPPAMAIFLDVAPSICKDRIGKRMSEKEGRKCEAGIDLAYLDALDAEINKLADSMTGKTVVKRLDWDGDKCPLEIKSKCNELAVDLILHDQTYMICCLGKTSEAIVTALKTVATKCNGHWDGVAVFDVEQAAAQVVSRVVQPAQVTNSNKFENGIAVWPSVKSTSGNVISGAAVVCALYAANDAARNNIPVRSIGNTEASILGACLRSDGVIVSMEESDATEIQQNGIVTFLNVGGGTYVTWGDHTSAMVNGSVTDERARYDSNIRVLQLLSNRFQQKYRFDIDNPMTLTMRNSVIQEENDYLAYLKSVGAIIGEASCQFLPDDNPADNIALGQFVWSIAATVTPPMKYAQLNVGFTSAGYSAYYEAA